MKPLLVILVILLTSQVALSQQATTTMNIDQLSDSVQMIMERKHIAGLMLGITTKDSVIFSGGFGYADVEQKRKTNANTLFRMGSVTKMFVSLGIMKLVEEGKLHLNDELKVVAPEIPFKNEWESKAPVRIIHLLEHTSGFDDIKLNHMYSLDTAENKGIDMVLVHQHSMIARWKPGERTAYSNPNYAILGYIIQKISGKPYGQYLKETILDPLGMRESNFNVRSKYPDRDVKEYTYCSDNLKQVPSVTLLSGPQGALWSCADDMVKFLQLFLRNGKPLFNDSTIKRIETPVSALSARSGLKTVYASGNRIAFVYNKYPFRGHDGITGTCYSSCFYNSALNIGFVISSNSDMPHYEIEQLVLSFIEQNTPAPKLLTQSMNENMIKPFLGTYQFESPRNEIAATLEKLQNVQRIYLKNGELYIKPFMGHASKLLQTDSLIFAYEGMNSPLIVFTKNESEQVMSIGGTYYEKTSTFWSITKRVIILLALIFSISIFIFGIVSTIGAMLGKVKLKDLAFRILPVLSMPFFAWAIQYLFDMKIHSYKMYELTTFNVYTFFVFLGTLFFAIASLLFLIYAMIQFRKMVNRWFAWYVLLSGLSLTLITIILLDAGWIGMRTWAM